MKESAAKPLTPQESQPQLAKALGLSALYFKREDLHPYRSHKGRSIPLMIDTYLEKGSRHFAISSSGNASLAAALYCLEKNKKGKNTEAHPIKLDIYVGKNIAIEKLSLLKQAAESSNGAITISQVERPIQSVFKATIADQKIQTLRQSTDDTALVGYKELARELSTIDKLEAVFIPTSSGTTAQSLALNLKGVQIHIVQTMSVHPIATEFDSSSVNADAEAEHSVAGAIADKTGHRKKALADLITRSNGGAWIVTDDEINDAMELVNDKTGLAISPNSALSVAGLIQAKKNGANWRGPVVCLITGA